MFPDGSAFWEFFEKVKMNTNSRTAITIKLLDEGGIRQMTWTLTNAGPTTVTVADIQTNTSEIVVEMIEIVHEGITLNESQDEIVATKQKNQPGRAGSNYRISTA